MLNQKIALEKKVAQLKKEIAEVTPNIIIKNPINKLLPTEGYIISVGRQEGRIWIERLDGEGGDFRAELLYACIDKFYKEHF